jgi:hypothetical protein
VAINIPDTFQFTDPGNLKFDDMTIDVDMTVLEANLDNGAGVMCRSSASQDYEFEISNDGYYSIFHWDEEDGFSPLVDWSQSPAIKTGKNQVNHITVTCSGNNLILSVNGELLAHIINDSISSGGIGLFGSTYEQGGLKVEFDNLEVTRPSQQEVPSETTEESSPPDESCRPSSTITEEDVGKLIEVCGKVTNWGDVPCPDCAYGGYSYLTLDKSFTIISYEWRFNDEWIDDCIKVADEVEMLGNDPVFVFGKGEGYAGSNCTYDSAGAITCEEGEYFIFYSGCD